MRDRPLAVFAAAAALVALHAANDAFVRPARGTSAGDHLVPGISSLVVLAALVALFVRARPGARAALASVLAAWSAEGVALAVAGVQRVTGLLLLAPATLALAALAGVLLWRSRRGGRLVLLRRAGRAVGAVALAYLVVAPVGVAILATHRPRHDVRAAELGAPYRAVAIRTRDGLRLAASYVPSRNGAAVVSYPTRAGKVPQARMLVRHGYGVLLLDARGYDGSEGAPNMFGWGETEDVDAAVDWLRRRPDVHDGRIGGIGFSVGGEMMIEAAARNANLKAVVSEGAGVRSVREEWLYGARGVVSIPCSAVQTAALTALSGTPAPPALPDLVARIAPRAVFLIEAENGTGGEELNRAYFDAAQPPKELWRVAGAGHTGAYAAAPAEYERRVVEFFDHYLGASAAL
ncbi:MAG TPA: alpha/beta fold hydrolase [Gaiellaceae bacterium]